MVNPQNFAVSARKKAVKNSMSSIGKVSTATLGLYGDRFEFNSAKLRDKIDYSKNNS